MSYYPEDNIMQTSLRWYEAGKCSEEGPSSSATQDAQATPAIEDFGELTPLVQYLRYDRDSQLNTSSYPTVDPCSLVYPSVPRMRAASPSFVGPSSWSAQPWDDPRMSPLAFIGDESRDEAQCGSETGDREPGDSEWVGQQKSGSVLNDQEVPVGEARRRRRRDGRIPKRPLEDFQLEDIKLKSAEGYSMAEIAERFYPGHTAEDFKNRFRGKWSQWTRKQDQDLIRLHEEKRDDWVEISNKLPGVARNTAEVRTRLKTLNERGEDGEEQHKESRGHHTYSQAEDDDIRSQLARGVTYGQLAKENYRHLRRQNIRLHARRIGASWSKDDDRKLRENVLRYEDHGMAVDWRYIGR